MTDKHDKWVQSQVDKYADPKKGYGEADTTVDRNYKAYQEAIGLVKEGTRFLDLGTNSGRVVWEAKKRGAIELGIDLPEVTCQVKYDVNLEAMNLEANFPEGEWDVVYSRETIEHLRNYKDVCVRMIKALSADGILVLTAPRNKIDSGKNCPEHVRVFEGTELDKLVKASGGKIIKVFNERRQRVVIAKRK